MTPYRHTKEMGEISGFGGSYEKCCQDMLEAGVLWIMTHPDADLSIRHSPQITGLFESATPDAEALEKVILDASFDPETGRREATGAQMHAIMMRLMFIKAKGWVAYVAELEKGDPDEDDAA